MSLELKDSSILCKTEEEFLEILNELITGPWFFTKIWSNGHRYQLLLINTITLDQKTIIWYNTPKKAGTH